MKVTHRRNINKRKDKWGYESNSTIGLDLAGAAANVIAPDAGDDDLAFEEAQNAAATMLPGQ